LSCRLILLVLLLSLLGLRAGATECGVTHQGLTRGFAGHWQSASGERYDLAPGTVIHRFTIHLASGDETRRSRYHIVTGAPDGEPDHSSLDCRPLTMTERDQIEKDMAALIDPTDPAAGEFNRQRQQVIDDFHDHVANPPYPMMAFSHYESQQWLILIRPDQLLDVWYDEGNYSTELFTRLSAAQK
jgi:hypothetical protein